MKEGIDIQLTKLGKKLSLLYPDEQPPYGGPSHFYRPLERTFELDPFFLFTSGYNNQDFITAG
jgi:hypothetical protein